MKYPATVKTTPVKLTNAADERTKTTFYQIWPIHWVKNEVHFITKIYHPLSTLTLTLIACVLTFGQTGH